MLSIRFPFTNKTSTKSDPGQSSGSMPVLQSTRLRTVPPPVLHWSTPQTASQSMSTTRPISTSPVLAIPAVHPPVPPPIIDV